MIAAWTTLEWRDIGWLWLALQPLVMLAIVALQRRWRHGRYADDRLLPWVRAPRASTLRLHIWRQMLLGTAWLAFAIAMAGPRLPEYIYNTRDADTAEVMLVVDISRSMSAADVTPNRIERSKLELNQLIERAQNLRFGLVVYAARSHLLSPPTDDKSVLQHYLAQLRTQMLPTEGTQLSAALQFAAAQFSQTARARAILLVSDGEIHNADIAQYTQLMDSVDTLKPQQIAVHVLGMGTTEGASLLDSRFGWLVHQGQPVISKLNPALLQELAVRGNGHYAVVSDDDRDWQTLYQGGLAKLRLNMTDKQDNGQIIVWRELYHYFAIAGAILLLAAYWQTVRTSILPRRMTAGLGLAAITFIFLMHNPTLQAAEPSYRNAHAAYVEKDYQRAQKLFSRISGYAARFGEGSAHYQLGDYPAAIAQFITATLAADTDPQRAIALFNLGNSYYKHENYAQAIVAYEDALRYQPQLQTAKVNLSYAQAIHGRIKPAEPGTAERAGRGPRSALAPENMAINQSRLTLDDRPNVSKLPSADTPPGSEQVLTPLLDQAKPAATRIEREDDQAWTYDMDRVDTLHMQTLFDAHQEHRLWQRLFEWEENFPAPVAAPHTLPGVTPW